MSMEKMLKMNGTPCACGRDHSFSARVISGSGVLAELPDAVRQLGGTKAYVLSDQNTYAAAGAQACDLLKQAGIAYMGHCFREEALEPDEESVGAAVMHMDTDCDIIIGVGSGVINDISKILACLSRRPYIIVATAPSMDGYASATSSMNRAGLKVSLPSRCADVIIGDSRILCRAPLKMLRAGLGDMVAKYISICEWRIANLLLGEYYCPEVAQLVREAVDQCVSQAEGLLKRDENAALAVFEGLVIGGVAMNYAGLSRPASGMEHYISHAFDMRAVAFGTGEDLHGMQCAVGTRIAAALYERLKSLVPDREKALAHVAAFNYGAWSEELRKFLGKGAESMIALEAKEKKYDPTRHAARLEKIIALWPEILEIVRQEIPEPAELDRRLAPAGLPETLGDIGQPEALLPMVLRCTKDIRDKYVLSRIVWDLGLEDQLFGKLEAAL